jgi:hypothetical protein
MENLEELNKKTNAYLIEHWDNGGTSEFDKSINDISRDRIKAVKEKYGTCFMYKINKWDQTELTCVEFVGQKVFNFEFDLILPKRNEELIKLIDVRNAPKTEEYSNKRNMDEVKAIFDIVEKNNGISLVWS